MTTAGLPVVVGTGGTIGCVAAGPDDLVDYGASGRRIAVHEMLDRLDLDVRGVDVQELGFYDSNAIGPEQWRDIRSAVIAASAGGRRPVVLTHGTATMEDTAYFLSLTLPSHLVVVVTGSQRPWGATGSDAPRNLADALRVAGSSVAEGHGVVVVMNGQIHAAADVTKAGTYELDAFSSGFWGPIGTIGADGVVRMRRSPGPVSTDAMRSIDEALPPMPEIELVTSFPGSGGHAIRAARRAGVRGVVIEALAPGLVTPAELVELRAAIADGICVVVSSRSRRGSVVLHGELAEAGAVSAGGLVAHKARIALMVAVAFGLPPGWVASAG